MAALYDAFDIPMSDAAAERCRRSSTTTPPGKRGIHRYARDEFGVVPERVGAEFRECIDQFDLCPVAGSRQRASWSFAVPVPGGAPPVP